MADVKVQDLKPDIVVFAVSGKLSAGAECREIETRVDKLLGQNRKKFVFDLSNLTYLDSSAIGTIALAFGKAKNAGGGVAVAGAKGSVEEVFRVTRINNIVPMFPDVTLAAAALAKPA